MENRLKQDKLAYENEAQRALARENFEPVQSPLSNVVPREIRAQPLYDRPPTVYEAEKAVSKSDQLYQRNCSFPSANLIGRNGNYMQRDENTFTFQQNRESTKQIERINRPLKQQTNLVEKVGANTSCNLKRRQSSKSINSKGMVKSLRNHHSTSGSAKNIAEKPNTALGLKSGGAGMKRQMAVGLRGANENST